MLAAHGSDVAPLEPICTQCMIQPTSTYQGNRFVSELLSSSYPETLTENLCVARIEVDLIARDCPFIIFAETAEVVSATDLLVQHGFRGLYSLMASISHILSRLGSTPRPISSTTPELPTRRLLLPVRPA